MHPSVFFLSIFLLLSLSSLSFSFPSSSSHRPWLDSSLPVAQRVQLLLANMTLVEKLCQLNHIFPPSMTYADIPAPYNTSGIGALTIESTPALNPTQCNLTCRITNLRLFQETLMNNTRLGIPVTFVIETSHSGAVGGTIFPMGVTQGASWNVTLINQITQIIALEARSFGGDRGLSPEINVVTDGRFGRTEENFGEDPYHVTTLATAAVLGLVGNTLLTPLDYLPNYTSAIIPEAKHCCVYGYGGYDGASADISDKTLHDIYLKPWKAFITNGGRGMMLSHNDLNGIQMHSNGEIMTDLFRTIWNYTGFYGSDYDNIDALTNAHVAANITQAAQLALVAGMDQSFSGNAYTPSTLEPAVTDGYISLDDIDRAAGNMLVAKFAAGLFDGALPDPSLRPNIYAEAHQEVARQTVEQSAVLLRNTNNILPLTLSSSSSSTGISRIAIIGPNSGCPSDSILPPPPVPNQTCSFTQSVDCPENDITSIKNITDAATCCALCLNHSSICNVAVWASDADQCLLKSACPAPIPYPNRVAINVGRIPPVNIPPTPWTCQAQRAMLGGYSNQEQTFDALNDNHAHVFTVLESAVNAANNSNNAFEVYWAPGSDVQTLDTSGFADAVNAANMAEVAIVVLGDSAEAIGYDSSVSCGEGADRPSLDLPGVQLDLLYTLLTNSSTPIIVILAHGRPVTFGSDYGGSLTSKFTMNNQSPLNERVDGLISAWRPGCEAGNGLWNILTGIVSPSGRLAQAWPYSAGALRLGGTSPWYKKYCSEECGGFTLGTSYAPMYPFGYGLDYLQVTYGTSTAFVNTVNSTIDFTLQVSNTATYSGDKVIQIYFSQAVSIYTRYERMLGAFTKINIPAGTANKVINLSVDWKTLSHYDPPSGNMILESGEFTFYICHASTDCPTANTHTVTLPTAQQWFEGIPRGRGHYQRYLKKYYGDDDEL